MSWKHKVFLSKIVWDFPIFDSVVFIEVYIFV